MCALCGTRPGQSTNIAFAGMIYYAIPLCLTCTQIAAVSYRYPQLAQQIHTKLLSVSERIDT